MIFALPSNLMVETLDYSKHDRKAFCCGIEPLDRYIQQYARQDFNRSLAIPYVFIDKQNPRTILGYYTLSNQSLDLKLLPNTISKNIPYPSVPTTLIGRLAIDKSYQGRLW